MYDFVAVSQRSTRHWAVATALVGLLLACARGPAVGSPTPSTDAATAAVLADTTSVPLIIRNRSYFDINVYAHRAANSPGRRVATVSSGSEGTFKVSNADLTAGRQLMLGVRAIAGRSAWVSPSLAVGNNVIARLDVMSDSNGDLGRSVLYLENK